MIALSIFTAILVGLLLGYVLRRAMRKKAPTLFQRCLAVHMASARTTGALTR